jgi:hypothetical protein
MQPQFNNLNKLMFSNRKKLEKETTIEDENAILTGATLNQSGNSDVDVNVTVEVDTMPIALAILCQAYIKKELNNEQLESAVNKLTELTDRYRDINRRSQSEVLSFKNNTRRR